MDDRSVDSARHARERLPIDRWTMVYLLASGLYPLLKPSVHPDVWQRLLLHVVLAAAVFWLPPLLRSSRVTALRLAGEIYLPLMFPLFYSEMHYLVRVFFPAEASLDPWFVALEQQLFGGQPSQTWWRAWPWPWWHEIMEAAYFSYYFLSLAALALILRAPGLTVEERWPALRRLIRDLGGAMLVCYTLYVFLPVWGPKYFDTEPIPVGGWIFTSIMHQIHANGAALGAAFPSSHVAASMIPWWHVWRHFPRHRAWLTTVFVLLCASTVYCRYHYVVDVIGGLLLGGIILWMGRRRSDHHSATPTRARVSS